MFLLFSLFLYVSLQSPSFANSEVSGERIVELEKTVLLGTQATGAPRAEVSLGAFRPGTILSCTIKVKNAGERTLQFSRTEAGCNCMSVSPQAGELCVGETIEFHARIKTQSSPSRESYSTTYTGHQGSTLVFGITLQYSFNGIVGFSASSAHVKVPRGSKNFNTTISFFCDAATTAGLIDVYVGPTLKGLDISLDFEVKKVLMHVPDSFLDSGRRFGELFVTNIETGFVCSMPLTFESESPISIFPSKLRFRAANAGQHDNASDDFWVANLMVVDKNRDARSEIATVVEIRFAGHPLKMSVSKTYGKVTHYTAMLDREFLAKNKDAPHVLTCSATGHNAKLTIELPLSVDDP